MKLPIYAYINLSSEKIELKPVSECCYKKYFGGKALAARLLLDLYPPGADALSPESVIIINTAPLNGSGAPSSSRFNISSKNVMTGGIASSNCGGSFGIMLKRAGIDGIVITGRADKPTHIQITDGEINLLDASDIWGLDTEKAQEHLPAHYGRLVIGPAGENLVRYASAVSGERVAGRCGVGAVLGSKNIKALTAYGTAEAYAERKEDLDKFIVKWTNFIQNHPMTGQSLPRYGSAGIVSKANAAHALPTRNFKEGYYAEADSVSGETMADEYLTRNYGCLSCPIRCERRVRRGEKEIKGPEYETLGLFGPNISSSDLGAIIEINYICDIMGMDTISAAGTIAFAMELKERGIADFGVEFGDAKNLAEVMIKIANREGIYSELGNGSKWLSEKYGGAEYAMHVKGLEMASYEPRRSYGMGLGYATSNRGGCHLNGGYMALLESVGALSIKPRGHKAKPELSVFMQDALDAVSSSGFCLFSAQTFVPSVFFKLGPNSLITRVTGKILSHSGPVVRLILKISPALLLNSLFLLPHAEALRLATGARMYTGQFIRFGERCYNLERMFNLREGLTDADDTLPERLTKTPQPDVIPGAPVAARRKGSIPGKPADASASGGVVPLDKMLPRYYKTRGWDKHGVPTAKKLKSLGIEV